MKEHQKAFYQRKLEEAKQRMYQASVDGNFKAFEVAELDVQNYERALKALQE